jgi:hypothetical protein
MNPLSIPGTRICIIRCRDETTVCANIAGFRAFGEWMAWLAASNPEEGYHFHVLWHLESEASRFESIRPRNVWVLTQVEEPAVPAAAVSGGEVPQFELTFQVLGESDLDELAEHQHTGHVPPRFQKKETSLVVQHG